MINISFQNGQYKTEKKAYIQYDYGQEIQIIGLEYDENLIFQFVKNGVQYDGTGTYSEGVYTVKVPDEVLAEAGPFGIYCFYEHELEGHTEKLVVIDVLDREMYPPREPEVYHDIIAQILNDIARLQYELDHFELSQEQLDYITQQVIAQIDLTDYYTKEEVDALIPDISGLATKTELNNGLAEKADKTDTYTKTQVDNLIPDVSGFATKTELTNGLANKADKSTTYTKTEVDNLIPDVSDFATHQDVTDEAERLFGAILPIIQTKANSADVYTKSEVYNKTEIDATLGNIQTLLEAI